MSIEANDADRVDTVDEKFLLWRRMHRASSYVLGVIALLHCSLTFYLYPGWTPESVWFLGTGLGLLLLAVGNISHVGLEPCHQPTSPVIRIANWIYLLFGIGAVIAVPEVQAYSVLAALFGQAIAGQKTLGGPT